MGRGGKRGGRGGGGRGRGRGGGRGGGRDHGEDNRVSFDKVEKHNEMLERFYNGVLGLSEEEKEEFWKALKRELPNSFRFAGSKGHALAVQRLLKERYIPEISKISHYDGTLVEAPKTVPWYPDELAWWMTTPKNVVRRFPPFAAFQKYLVSETSVGNISRQEVVSMIPPLVMDLQPGMTVLDMCAAPGSKAAQLLEMVHRGEEARVRKSLQQYAEEDGRQRNSPEPDNGAKLDDADELAIDASDYGRATGLLIANDSDYKRSHMLIHQLKRLSSPNLIVTNHDATLYPSIKLPGASGKRYLKFDRILADVPCSGDGTTRKNVNLWQDWNPGNALGLYVTQVRILVRALQMLKVGGRVVYSTCSMNPVENEAVICSAIERCGGLEKVRLLNSDDKLPLLKRKPGLKSWSIMGKGGHVWDSWADVESQINESGPDFLTDRLVEGMFTPPPNSPSSQIPLEQCMRVYAHQQDTGGFFIAILEKLSEFRAIPESDLKKVTNVSASTNGVKRGSEDDAQIDAAIQTKKLKTIEDVDEPAEPGLESSNAQYPSPGDTHEHSPVQAPRPHKNQQFEEPFKYISGDHPEVKVVEEFYQLSPRFPRDRFLVRNTMGEPTKTIYYTSALIRDILTENEGKGIKFIHGGVKMFMKQDVQREGVCKWRIQSEGMPILEGYVGEERVVRLYKKETLRKLLIEMFPKVSDGGWKNLGEIGERVNSIGMGCCVLRIEPSSAGDGFDERMVLPLWRSLHSLNLMLSKEDRTAMLLRIFNDTTPLVNSHNPTKKADRPAQDPAEPAADGDADAVPDSKNQDETADVVDAVADAVPDSKDQDETVDEVGAVASARSAASGAMPDDSKNQDETADKISDDDTATPTLHVEDGGDIDRDWVEVEVEVEVERVDTK